MIASLIVANHAVSAVQSGFDGAPPVAAGVNELAGGLKKGCGVGGSVGNGVIEVSGEDRGVAVELVKAEAICPCSLEADARR